MPAQKYMDLIEHGLKKSIVKNKPDILYEAMTYYLFIRGKRLRPMLLLSAADTGNDDGLARALPYACVVEIIHTYSLIHDDLPAMDDDDFRRGHPTTHKIFGDAVAILAGDGLLNIAYEIMISDISKEFSHEKLRAMSEIATASGRNGMVGGQTLDIIAENSIISESQLDLIHKLKTAALIKASLVAGASLGGHDEKIIKVYSQIGEKLGLAFQIQDDLLDVTSTSEYIGKPINSDIKNNKTTYTSMYGVETAQKNCNALFDEIFELLEATKNVFLMGYLKDIMLRKK